MAQQQGGETGRQVVVGRALPSPFSGYARLYGPLAVAALPVAFFPVLESETVVESPTSTRTVTYGTLWETAVGANGQPAVFGLLLLAVLVTLLTIATFRAVSERSRALPVGTAVTAGAVVLMLVTKPGAHAGADLAPAGVVGLVLAVATVVLSTAHAIHLGRHDKGLRRHTAG
jgi:hypothetical protein